MKLILLLAAMLSHSLFAAEISGIKKLSNSRLEALKLDFSSIKEANQTFSSETFAFKINLREDDEMIETVIEQMLMAKREKEAYEAQNIVIAKIKKGNEEAYYQSLVESLQTNLFKKKSVDEKFEIVKPTKNLLYFEVHDENKYGYCDDLAIFDIKNSEVLFLGSCYVE